MVLVSKWFVSVCVRVCVNVRQRIISFMKQNYEIAFSCDLT